MAAGAIALVVVEVIVLTAEAATLIAEHSHTGDTGSRLDLVMHRLQQLEDTIKQVGADILRAIDQLEHIVNDNFTDFAVAHAAAAVVNLRSFRRFGADSDRSLAESNSTISASFFGAKTNPSFMGGLLFAGTVRLDIIRTFFPTFFKDAAFQDEINSYANSLAEMVRQIKAAIVRENVVKERGISKFESDDDGPPFDKPRRVGVGVAVEYISFKHVESSYFVADDASPQDRAQARSSANRDRAIGLDLDLKAAKIPELEAIVTTWRNIAGNKTQQLVFATIMGRAHTRLDTTTTATRIISISTNQSRLPPEQVPFLVTNVRPYMLDLIRSSEFRRRVEKKTEAPELAVKLALRQVFGRRPEAGEIKPLVEVLKRHGMTALLSCLLYSDEYERRYGCGLPCPDEHDTVEQEEGYRQEDEKQS
jgi:Phycobilisome Linker polypeptide